MTRLEPFNDKLQVKDHSVNFWGSLVLLVMLVLLCLSVEQLESFFMTEDSYHWFQVLQKPSWTPPSFIFPLASTLLYVLMAIAAWRVWYRHQLHHRLALLVWTIQLTLNALWAPLFFAQQQIFYGLIVIYLLWLFVLLTTIMFYKHSKLACFLMIPQFLWTSFVVVLNFVLWQMNS